MLITERNVFFSDFRYGFWSFWSTADLLTVASNRIARTFNKSGATRVVAFDISKGFDRVWHVSLLRKLKSHWFSGQIFPLISSILSNRQLRVFLDGKSSQEYPVNARVPQWSILGPKWPSWWCYLWYCYLSWWYYSILSVIRILIWTNQIFFKPYPKRNILYT